jgi:hypothetical protein
MQHSQTDRKLNAEIDKTREVLDTVARIFEATVESVREGLIKARFAGKDITADELAAMHPDLRVAVHFRLTELGRQQAERMLDQLSE